MQVTHSHFRQGTPPYLKCCRAVDTAIFLLGRLRRKEKEIYSKRNSFRIISLQISKPML